jgi:hypothetical protein
MLVRFFGRATFSIKSVGPLVGADLSVFMRRVRRRGGYFATGLPNFYSAVAPVSKHRVCSDTLTPGSSMGRSDLPRLLLDHAPLGECRSANRSRKTSVRIADDPLGTALGYPYSWRKAIIGSTWMARRAGR